MDYSPCNSFFILLCSSHLKMLWKYRHKHIKKILFTFRESLIIIIKYQHLLVKDLLYLHPRHKNAWNFFFFFRMPFLLDLEFSFSLLFLSDCICYTVGLLPCGVFFIVTFCFVYKKGFLFKMLSLNLIQGFFLFTLQKPFDPWSGRTMKMCFSDLMKDWNYMPFTCHKFPRLFKVLWTAEYKDG